MAVPNTFATATSPLPLSELDTNFATPITLGSTAVALGDTVTSVTGLNTTGNAGNVTGTVAIANGGTGQATASAAFNALSPVTATGDLIVGNGTNSATRLGIGTNGYVLTSNGTAPTWSAAGGVSSFSAGSTGLTPSTATTGAVTLAGTLAVTNGGTGVTTSTGTGANVLGTSPTITTPTISQLTSATATALTLQSAGTTAITVDTSQNVLVGTTSNVGSGKLTVQANLSVNNGISIDDSNSSSGGTFARFSVSSGTLCGYIARVATTNAVSYSTTSDYRLKENIVPMTGALSKIAQLKPVTYRWKDCGVDSQGFIAHELQAVVPDCVNGEKDAVDKDGNPVYQGIDTSFLVATLTAAIQELKAINDTQAETINALTARLEALENR